MTSPGRRCVAEPLRRGVARLAVLGVREVGRHRGAPAEQHDAQRHHRRARVAPADPHQRRGGEGVEQERERIEVAIADRARGEGEDQEQARQRQQQHEIARRRPPYDQRADRGGDEHRQRDHRREAGAGPPEHFHGAVERPRQRGVVERHPGHAAGVEEQVVDVQDVPLRVHDHAGGDEVARAHGDEGPHQRTHLVAALRIDVVGAEQEREAERQEHRKRLVLGTHREAREDPEPHGAPHGEAVAQDGGERHEPQAAPEHEADIRVAHPAVVHVRIGEQREARGQDARPVVPQPAREEIREHDHARAHQHRQQPADQRQVAQRGDGILHAVRVRRRAGPDSWPLTLR